MSEPKNHHWLPRFLLSQWYDSKTQKVLYFHRPYSEVKFTWGGVRNIGSTKFLYTVNGPGFNDPQFIETSFMQKVIDDPAAKIHRQMLNGEVEALGIEERMRWSCFMVMLMTRHPDAIRPKQKTEEQIWKETCINIFIGQKPTGHTQPLDRDEAEAFYNHHFVGSGRDVVMKALVNLPFSSPYVSQIMSLEWRVLRLNRSQTAFFLGDNPIMINLFTDIDRPYPIIKSAFMPLSPDVLFVAGDREYFSKPIILLDGLRFALANIVMQYQFSHARDFVIVKYQGEAKNQYLIRFAEEHQYLKKRNKSSENESAD